MGEKFQTIKRIVETNNKRETCWNTNTGWASKMHILMITSEYPIDHIMIDEELRDEYEKEFGLDSNDTGYDYYTHEEQI